MNEENAGFRDPSVLARALLRYSSCPPGAWAARRSSTAVP